MPWQCHRDKLNHKELQVATNNFSSKNMIGKGGFRNVYNGYLQDGTVVAVKWLNDGNAVGGEKQFQTELEMISLAVHRNLLKLIGFRSTDAERILVSQYRSVASRLKGKPPLDWSTRKRIALGAARGLLYLHEQCDPKIIHIDVKLANILLDDICIFISDPQIGVDGYFFIAFYILFTILFSNYKNICNCSICHRMYFVTIAIM